MIICYYDGRSGGTEYTIEYAETKKIEIKNLSNSLDENNEQAKIIDNIHQILRDDLERVIRAGDRVSILGDCFSIYAFYELRQRLNKVKDLRFIFNSPTFITDKVPKEKREFYIPRLSREKSLYGTEFEVRLRNELNQKAIARECAKWIEEKVTFKSNVTNDIMTGFIHVDKKKIQCSYQPIKGFTTVDIGCERGNNAYNLVTKLPTIMSQPYIDIFNGIV